MNEDSLIHRFRLAAGCLALTAVAFIQQPGRIVADTKLDLVIDPGSFLARALTMWDPQGFFGQVQNQAYGYLLPMGPFFWLGDLAHIDAWVVQRLWWAVILCVAFLGAAKLCQVLGVGTPLIRIFAGLAFALSPRFLTVLGPSSIEVWPSALAPWVLVPLVVGLKRGNPRRWATMSALVVACVGGVNAVATFAVIPLGALWLLVAPRGPRRRALMLWWPPLILLACAWWLVPLFLLGSYSPPFLDYIESASVTTTAATAFDALRGTTNWVPYVSTALVAGKDLFQNPMVIINAGVLLLLGIIGMTMRDLPHRRFLVLGMLVGLTLVTLGHTGSVQGWGALPVQEALDGVLAPLRNTHKFDVVVRLPLVIAAAHGLAVLRRTGLAGAQETALRRAAVALIAVTALAGASVPAWTGHIANRGTFEALPGYWVEAAHWLDKNAATDGGTALMVPSSAFAEYIWGRSGDEPMQPLARSSWAVRNSIPLTPSSTIRMLDSITDGLAQGAGSVGLATTLRRAGVEFLVVRNDLQTDVAAGRVEALYRTVDESPGVSRVISFGPDLGGSPSIDLDTIRTFANGGWQSGHPAVDIYRIEPDLTRTQSASATPTLVGGADTLAALDSLGVVKHQSVVLAQDRNTETFGAPLIVTDGLRRQEVSFGSVDNIRSASIARDEPFTLARRVHDYLDPSDKKWLSVPQMRGARSLAASSARSLAAAAGGVRPSTQPWSAFDGDVRSAWAASRAEGWIRLRLTAKTDLGMVTIRPGLAPGERERLTVSTEEGKQQVDVSGPSPVHVQVGHVDSVQVSGVNLAGKPFTLAEIASSALIVSRPLVVPRTPVGWGPADTIAFGLAEGRRPGCLEVEAIVRCRSGVLDRGEDGVLIDREFSSAASASYGVAVRTVPVVGQVYDALEQEGLPVEVHASSTANSDVRSSISRVLDGDLRTGWVADVGDTDPTLSVSWTKPHTLSAIVFGVSRGLPASLPETATLELEDGTQRQVKVRNGVGSFEPITTSRIVVRLRSDKSAVDYLGDVFGTVLPVGFSELSFKGAPTGRISHSTNAVTLPCGSGPSITVNGTLTKTAVTTTPDDLANGQAGNAQACDGSGIVVGSGTNRLVARASGLYLAGQVVLSRLNKPPASTVNGPTFVVDHHNVNSGWIATANGTVLKPIRINGWQQGWMVPSGVSTSVKPTFAPERTYRAGLAVGLLTLLLVIGSVLIRGRPRASVGAPMPRKAGWFAAVAATVALGMLGGTPFVLLGFLGLATAYALDRRSIPAAWVAGMPLLLALMCYALRPWGTSGAWVGTWHLPQWCVAVSLGAVIFSLFQGTPVFQRRKGSSTQR